MIDTRQVMYDIERCISHVPDACRDCSHYKHGEYLDCMEELLKDALAMLKEQNGCENCAIAIEDRQPVVRCKDCKHRGNSERCVLTAISEEKDVPLFILDNRGNWFCADGKPKESR